MSHKYESQSSHSAAHHELVELIKLEINSKWFVELVELIQIHFGYKSLADQGQIELIREILSFAVGSNQGCYQATQLTKSRFVSNKNDLIEFCQNETGPVPDADKVKKFINTKNHSYFRHQKVEIEINDEDYELVSHYNSRVRN